MLKKRWAHASEVGEKLAGSNKLFETRNASSHEDPRVNS